ncbi:MAG: DUF4231 domain-containing protein [Bacteroidetes bacterium]|nr:DUF4231 domain-containing protein [Bacteroidota bacterium]MCW5897263.1 DUF4231 domain-containing protein [Bacteroidota bacterium]
MPDKSSYHDWLKKNLGSLIDSLTLTDLQKRFLHSRWLDQVMWMEASANKARSRYYALRMVTIIGGVLVPALISLNLAGAAADVIKWSTVGISLLVGMSAAIEEFFHFGERWRHYRRNVESLKTTGWLFFQLSGPFSAASHAEAYRSFASHVEEILQQDVNVYIGKVVQEASDKKVDNRQGEVE